METNNKTAGETAKIKQTFCKACGKETKNGNEFCTPEEGRNWTGKNNIKKILLIAKDLTLDEQQNQTREKAWIFNPEDKNAEDAEKWFKENHKEWADVRVIELAQFAEVDEDPE